MVYFQKGDNQVKMKKIISLILCFSVLLTPLCLLTSCGNKKIELTRENYSNYIMINVEIENYRKEENKYYADITIVTDRAANVEFEGAKLKEAKDSSVSSALAKAQAANKKGLTIDLNYLGESRTTFTYSSALGFSNNYESIISKYKTGWDVEGYVIIP